MKESSGEQECSESSGEEERGGAVREFHYQKYFGGNRNASKIDMY